MHTKSAATSTGVDAAAIAAANWCIPSSAILKATISHL